MSLPLFFICPLLTLGCLKVGRVLMLAHCMEQVNEARACLRCLEMLCSKRLLTNGQGTSIPNPGLFTVALHFPKLCKVVHGLSCNGMLKRQGLFADRQSALVERLGLRILALLTIEKRQVVEWGGHLGMLRSQLLLPDAQGALKKR